MAFSKPLALAPARITAAPQRRTPHLSARPPFGLVMSALLLAVPIVLVLGIAVGAAGIGIDSTVRVIGAHLTGGLSEVAPVDDQIIWQIRAPRVLLSFVVGSALAVAGAVLQAVVRNPLADPYILGVASGASCAAVAVLTLGAAGGGIAAVLGVSGAAFVGALGTLAAVIALGRGRRGLDAGRLLLAGVALSYLLQAGTSYLQLRAAPDQVSGILFWLLGSVSSASWSALGLPSLVLVLCTGWLCAYGRRLNAILLGDESAAALGIPVARFRLQLLVISALLTAVVIAVAGGVGFVGLIAPHCVRLLIGPDHRRLLPAAALLGGVFLVAADLAGRSIAAPLELPLSVVTAVAGVPFFLLLLRRRTGSELS